MSDSEAYDPRTPPDDPWNALAALRREAAVAHFDPLGADDPGIDVVLRHEACRQAFLDTDSLSSRYNVKPDGDYSIVSSDPPEHTRQRKILNRTFPPERVEALHPRITEVVDELIDAFPESGPVEFMSAFGFHLPVIVLAELLGVPELDRQRFKEWSDEQLSQSLGGGTSEQAREFKQWALEQVRARRNVSVPADDLISALALAEDEDGLLDEWEAASTLVLLVVAGHETTTNALGNTARHLFGDREARESVVADRSLIPSVVEETLRFDPPVTALPRRATCPVHLDDSEIDEGRITLLHMGAANRDPAVFDNPDGFQVDRYMPDRPRRGHFAFGHGPHLCIGAPLARAEIRIALERLVARLTDLRLVDDQTIEQVPAYVFRGPQQLLLDYERKDRP